MEENIFTTIVCYLTVFAALLSIVVALIPHKDRFAYILVFDKKVGPKYWGRYEGTPEVNEVGTIEVKEPFYEDKVTFGSKAYSSGSTGV